MSARVLSGDCRLRVRDLPDNSVHAIVCDPPYDLVSSRGARGGFMGSAWDATGVAFDPATWRALLRVLRPGGYLLAFGGTRTWHRLAVAVEDAGFEVRDSLVWLYGTGWPKNGAAALKPAHEPIVLARRPLDGTLAENVARWGVGGLNIDASRIGVAKRVPNRVSRTRGLVYEGSRDGSLRRETGDEPGHNPSVGRYPPNVILNSTAAKALDEQAAGYGDAGYVSRFFPVLDHDDEDRAWSFRYEAKASTREREEGLDALRAKGERRANVHPTVKPVALLRWLVRLVTPSGGIVLDPFAGSGTTGVACVREGLGFVGIEREGRFVEIARARIEHAREQREGGSR